MTGFAGSQENLPCVRVVHTWYAPYIWYADRNLDRIVVAITHSIALLTVMISGDGVGWFFGGAIPYRTFIPTIHSMHPDLCCSLGASLTVYHI